MTPVISGGGVREMHAGKEASTPLVELLAIVVPGGGADFRAAEWSASFTC